MTQKSLNRESGFTLLELLLVIGVAALLLIGGIATYRLVSEGNRATEATRLLLTIRNEGQIMAQQNPTTGYDGITEATFVASGILRAGQLNPFNGPIAVAGTGNQLSVTMGNIPRSACVRMFQAISQEGDIVSVGGVAPPGITPAAAAGACGAATNSLTWIFP